MDIEKWVVENAISWNEDGGYVNVLSISAKAFKKLLKDYRLVPRKKKKDKKTEGLRFVQSYKHYLVYENKDLQVEVYDYRLVFRPIMELEELELCDEYSCDRKE